MTIARWLKSLIRKTATIKNGRGKAPSPRRRRLLWCEWLEDRIVPLSGGGGGGGAGGIGSLYWMWNGNAGDGNWDTAGNWSFTPGSDWNGGQANTYPGQGTQSGENDFVTIDTGSAAATITIQASDNLFVQGLTATANDTLAISGSLTLEANSTLDGPLSLAGGNLTASGAGVSVAANATTTATAAKLFALGGATLNLPNLNTYDNATSNATTLQALGSGSMLELPGLASLGTLASTLNLSAQQGGVVNASALTLNGSTPNINLDAEDSGSQVEIPAPTALDGDTVFLDGGTIPIGQLTTFTNGALAIGGEAVTLSVLTDADGSSLTADGGATVSLPMLTSYVNDSSNLTRLSASGTGSLLDVSALTKIGTSGSSWTVLAQQGGEVNITGLTSSDFSNPLFFSRTINLGGTIDFAGGSASMPTSADAPTILVATLPQGATLDLKDTAANATFTIATGDTVEVTEGTFTGGTTFNVGAGTTVNVNGATITGGAKFNVAQSGTVALLDGTFSGTLGGSGSGTVTMPGNRVYVGVGGLTLDFQGDMFQWTGTVIDTALGNLINLGILNLTGPLEKAFDLNGELDNFGTIIQTGFGDLVMGTNGLFPATLKIEPGASYLIEGDSGLGEFTEGSGSFSQQLSIINEGIIRKTAGTGTSDLSVVGDIVNTGTIEADSGTLELDANGISQVANGSLTQGTWNALDGSTLEFPTGTAITADQANVTLSGAGATIDGIGGLGANSGSFTVTDGATFTTAGDFRNSGTLIVGAGSTLAVSGKYTQTSAGTLNAQLGGTPASGQFGQLVVTKTAALAGNFGVALVNGFGPTTGQDFQPLTFASVSGTFAQLTGLYPFFTATFNPTALDLVDGSTNAVDLVASSVTAPTAATEGQAITVNWNVNNPGSQAASGSWQDSIYLATTPSITSTSILLGATTHTGGLAAGGSYTGAWTGAVPAQPPGYYYVLVQVDSLYEVADPDRANNTLAASTGQLDVTLPVLTLGTSYNDAFTAADQDHYYQVTVPAGGTLVLSLASAAASGSVALYLSQDSLPTPYNYQEAATRLNQPNQTVTVPQVLTTGTYYVLAQSVSGAAASSAYTLTATQSTGLTVAAADTPYTGGQGGNVTVKIDGTNFTPALTASLTLAGKTPIPSSTIDFISASEVYATFNLATAATGRYVLSVTEGLQSATSPTPFQVVPAIGSAGLLALGLNLPSIVRSGRSTSFVVTYTNTSNHDLVAPVLVVRSTNSQVLFSTPDDPNGYAATVAVLGVAASGPAGILGPGQSGQITLSLLNEDTVNGDSLPVFVNQIEAGQTIDWASQEASLQPPDTPTAVWNVIFNNVLAMVGGTTDSYNAALAQAATYLGNLDETTAQVSDVSRLWSFLTSQADAEFPTRTLTSAVDAALPTPGSLPLAIDRTFNSTIAGRFTSGMFGLGWSTSWQTSLSVDSSGNVTIDYGGSLGTFGLQPNGSYLDADGEYGTLTLSGGIYTFTGPSGTRYVFLSDRQLDTVQDINGNRIALGYDSQGQLLSLTYANIVDHSEPAEQLSLTYNPQGFVSQEADGTGDVWTYQYDTAGHLLSVTCPGNLTTTYTYDTGANGETSNALLSITNPDGSQHNFAYSATTGQLIGSSANLGAGRVTYSYPGEGEVVATDVASNQTTVWFNDLGLASRAENALGGITNYQYDVNGNLVSFTDASGATYQYTYDTNGNLTQTVNPLGQTVHMTYNTLGDLTSLTDAAGNTTQYNYNFNDNLLSIAYPDGTSQQFTSYDPLGDPTATVLQNGDPITYQYNAEGLVTAMTFADGTSQTFSYDAHGNLLTANSFDANGTPTGTTTLTYNAANELTLITYPNGQFLDYTYDAQGQRTQSVDQSGYTVNYSFDALGRLAELTDGSNNLIVQYTYNNIGELANKLNGNGTSTTYAYDANGDLTQEVNYAGGTTVNSSFTYTYNVLDEQTSMTDASGNVTLYGYDASGQLTTVVLPGGVTIQYVYNAAGDRTEVLNSGLPTAYASNADNEITQVGSTTYTYDQNGNLQMLTDADGTTTYAYNDLNQLVSITNPDGSVQTFQNSPLGFMVGSSTTTGGNTSQTNYLVDPTGLGNVVASYDGSGSLVADYTYGLGLVSQTGPGGTGFYDFDAIGNTIGITGTSGTYVNQYRYLPFGETTTVTAALLNPFTFAGQVGVMQIGTNLFSMRARNYTPATGQFTSNDPLGLAAGDTNVRRYVGNAPTLASDPTGLSDYLYDPSETAAINALRQKLFEAADGVIGEGEAALKAAIEAGENLGSMARALNNLQPGTIIETGGGEAADIAIRNQVLANVARNQLANALANGAGGTGAAGVATGGATGASWYAPVVAGLPWVATAVGGLAGGFLFGSGLVYVFPGLGKLYELLPDDPNLNNQTPPHTVNSHDPNALIGPGGYGTQNFLQPTGTWPYTVDFENDGSTAAQTVTVTEQLDSNLDWATFQLGSFGFGPVNVVVPAGLTQYQTTVSYQNSDGTPLNVLVSINFNVQTGLLTVTYTSLDPLLGATPPGVFDGFLYPENGTGVGEGYIQYTVQPKANLATGTVITQQASVVFDTNAPLATDTSIVTIDSGAPSSSVTALPAYSLGSFTVSWSGQDDTGGSGIASYDVYVSDDDGPFTLWQQNTAQTSAAFTGQDGHTYGFFSVAIDNVGNVQPTPTSAQAMTSVDAVAPTSSVQTLPAFSPGSFTLSWSGSDNAGGSGLASYTVYVSEDNGGFQPYLTDTTLTSTTFTGQNGHTYGFYTIAKDNAGNVEQMPGAAEAMTTVDTIAPTSSVQALPANSLTSFSVSWSGQDNPSGSGLASFDIYDSVNNGAFQLWQNQTTKTSAIFNGLIGNTYAFYSVAFDIAGNEEAKSTPDTQTQTAVYQTILTESAGTSKPAAEKNSTLLGSHYSDPDGSGKTKPGIAVIAASGAGAWQYFNGTTWTTIAAVSTTSALLLPQADQLRFLSTGLGTPPASLLYVAWDGSSGTAGHYVNVAITGNATPFSTDAGELDVTLNAVTQAPVWLASSTALTPVLPGGTNSGETVQQAFGSVFTGDNGQSAGVAVVGATSTTAGFWQYALSSTPTQFTDIPKPPAGNAFLLRATDLIRFDPSKSTFTGPVSLSVHAWDGSGGFGDGTVVNLNRIGTGGMKPFSSATLTGKLYFNDAPTQNAGDVPFLTSIAENAPSKPVGVAALMNDAQASDADKNSVGMAITGTSGPGVWQYELAGGVWQNVPATLSAAAVLLLPRSAQLRFDPTVNQSGSATLNWDAWDGTQGTTGQQGFALGGTGGATAFSSTGATAMLTVTASQHPPAWSGSGAALTPVLPGTTTPQRNTVASVFGNYFEDPSATSMRIAVSGVTGTKNGQWYYSIDDGANWIMLPSVSASKALLLSANDLIAFVPKTGFLGTVTLTAYAWDGSAASGSHGNTTRAHGSDFSSTTLTATCLVNTAPTLEA